MKEYFTYISGVSNKFWGVEVKGSEIEVHYGRIGTGGTYLTKGYAHPYKAVEEARKLKKSKLAKGYVLDQTYRGGSGYPNDTEVMLTEITCEL